MNIDPVTATEDAEMKAVEQTMIEEQLHDVPVLRNGGVVGLITREGHPGQPTGGRQCAG